MSTMALQTTDFTHAAVINGTVVAAEPVHVARLDVPGLRLLVADGDAVDAGQPLYELDGEDSSVVEAQAAVNAAQREVDDALLALERAREDLQASRDPATADVPVGPRRAVEDAERMLARARAAFGEAAVRRDDARADAEARAQTLPTAPTSGVVAIEADQIAVHPRRTAIEAPISPELAYRLRTDMPDVLDGRLRISRTDELPVRCHDPQMTAAGTSDVPGSPSRALRCLLPDDIGAVPGLAAELVLPSDELADVFVVPINAFVATDTGLGLLVPSGDGSATIVVEATLLATDGSRAAVAVDLSEGDRIVVPEQRLEGEGR